MPFKFKKLDIPDVILVMPKIYRDDRGYFMEIYKESEFKENGIKSNFIQDNQSFSKYGVLRGLHFQLNPYAQAKLVRCVRGVIFDVAVDLRKDSPYFGKYVSIILSEYNKYSLYIPRGFAHGFLVLSDYAEVHYKVDNEYSPSHEYGLIWNDPEVDIEWPIEEPLLSEKDRRWPSLNSLIKMNKVF